MAESKLTKMTIEVDRKTAARVRQLTHPRLRKLSLQFHGPDVDAWQALAADNGESLTDLMERTMNVLTQSQHIHGAVFAFKAVLVLVDSIIAEPAQRDGKPAKELRIRDAIRALLKNET